jgi:P27 family predicted phage terminase small subunit
MARGPAPTPTALKLLRGNPGHRPINHDEPKPPVCLPDPPADMKGEALAEWLNSGPMLERLGLITEIDVRAFETYCRAWGQYKEAEAEVGRLGEVVKAPSGYPIQNPYRAIANKALTRCERLWAKFGMTPADRSRVHVQKGQTAPQSKLGEYMKRAK